jgi:catechol 2,3-dioxygenase-like lactoylglutathione lyase family enzyme
MKLERIDHFGIEVADLRRAERFYTEVLGLSVVTHLGDQALLDCGGQNLSARGDATLARETLCLRAQDGPHPA